MRNLVFTLFLTFSCCFSMLFAQRQEIDSLKKVLPKYAETDTNYINTLNELAVKYRGINPDTMLILAEKSIALADKSRFAKGRVDALINKGIVYQIKGDYAQALNMCYEVLPLAEEISYKKGIGNLYNNIALVYYNQGKYSEALENHFKALKIREEIGDKQGIAGSLNNIANIYSDQGKYPEALKNYFKSLQIREEIGDKRSVAASLNNIGIIYEWQGKYAEALENYFKSLKIKEEIGDKKGITASLSNIANVYIVQGKYAEALGNFFKALKMCEEIGNVQGIVYSKNGLAKVYLALKDYEQAIQYAQGGLEAAKKIGQKALIRDSNESLSKIYKASGKYELALMYHEQFKVYADSVNNLEVEKKAANLQAQYEFDRKTALMQAEQAQKDILQEKQRNQLYWVIFSAFLGLVFTFVILFLIFQSRKKIQNAYSELEISNAQVQQAKEEIEVQKDSLEEMHKSAELKNQLIQSSIRVAKVIQEAILPWENRFDKIYNDYFILYKPRDVVSGDFYWLYQQKDYHIIFVGDCTGHGVPGAFMSVIGSFLLNDIVFGNTRKDPSEILEELHRLLFIALKQNRSNNNHGMDAALCMIQKNDILDNYLVTFAGAKRPLYYYENDSPEKLQIIKGTRRSLGGHQNIDTVFENHTFSLNKGAMVYLSTDGFADQNNLKRKPFSEKALLNLLENSLHLPMPEQKALLEGRLTDFMENTEQRDDITLLGVKLS